jgi:molybdate transport system substrate-binding protein
LQALHDLAALRRLAIANPDHAPYGQRAQEALAGAGVWAALKPKLVLGENIAQTMKFVDSGAAEAGIVALSLVKAPALQGRGHWTLIPATAHAPLSQAWVITRRAADNPLAVAFIRHLDSAASRAVMARYGFERPAEPTKP